MADVERAAPPTERDPDTVCSSSPVIQQNTIEVQQNAPQRRVLKAEHGHYIEGNPSVVFAPRGSAIFVGLTSIPWGWQSKARTCEFYNAATAEKYAAKLVAMLDAAGVKEHQARERNRLLRLQERNR